MPPPGSRPGRTGQRTAGAALIGWQNPPAMQIRSIAYVSTESRPLPPEALEALLVDSRRRNLEHGITGVLLHCPGNFMQFFEGPPDGVEAVYRRILASRQHRSLIALCDEMSDGRDFPNWAMGSTEAPRSFVLGLFDCSLAPAVRRHAPASDEFSGPEDAALVLGRGDQTTRPEPVASLRLSLSATSTPPWDGAGRCPAEDQQGRDYCGRRADTGRRAVACLCNGALGTA
jgi:hypothetical protein